MTAKNPKTLRISNRAQVIKTLINKGELSRVQLAKILGLTTASITQIVHDLIFEGLVYEGEAVTRDGAGRREILIGYNDKHLFGLGVNIEADNIHISVCGFKTVLEENIYPTAALISGDDVSALINKIEEVNKKYQNISGIGVGIAGFVDETSGISENSFGILPKNYPLKDKISAALLCPVYISNNVRAQARALISDDNGDFMFIKHSPGIGSALVLSGKVVNGIENRAGEIGHTIVDMDGAPCRCGKKGCLETIISDKNISRRYFEASGIKLTAEEIYKRYNGDNTAKSVLDGCIDVLSLAIGNACMLTDPKKVLVTGGIFFDDNMLNLLLNKLAYLGFTSLEIKVVGNDNKIKAFAGARLALSKKLFEV